MQLDSVDQCLSCAGCGRDFNYPATEQAFFRKQGFKDPKNCLVCRKLNKEAKTKIANMPGGSEHRVQRPLFNASNLGNRQIKLTSEEMIDDLQDQLARLKEENSRLKKELTRAY
jgi:tRNA U34 5-methylaminomethyl-2-thiouridine-forming methyltransferase MnmC